MRRHLAPALALAAAVVVLCTFNFSPAQTKAAGGTFSNPVYKQDFADPFVLKVGKTYYAYSTNANNMNVPTIKSTDLVHWTNVGDAMPVIATWVTSDVWAPDIIRRSDGKYLLFYTGHYGKGGRQCIGVAVSNSPTGRFTDHSTKPFICQLKQGGDIDADVYNNKNGLYLTWKNDGNCCGIDTTLYLQRLSSDGMKLVGKPVKAVKNVFSSWENSVIEGPEMRQHAGKWYLFFSGNAYDSFSYAVGYATCSGPLGPCRQAKDNPILQTSKSCSAAGPGGETFITDAKGQWWVLYHAWNKKSVGYNFGGMRALWLDRVDWVNNKPVIHGPTCGKQPAPVV